MKRNRRIHCIRSLAQIMQHSHQTNSIRWLDSLDNSSTQVVVGSEHPRCNCPVAGGAPAPGPVTDAPPLPHSWARCLHERYISDMLDGLEDQGPPPLPGEVVHLVNDPALRLCWVDGSFVRAGPSTAAVRCQSSSHGDGTRCRCARAVREALFAGGAEEDGAGASEQGQRNLLMVRTTASTHLRSPLLCKTKRTFKIDPSYYCGFGCEVLTTMAGLG